MFPEIEVIPPANQRPDRYHPQKTLESWQLEYDSNFCSSSFIHHDLHQQRQHYPATAKSIHHAYPTLSANRLLAADISPYKGQCQSRRQQLVSERGPASHSQAIHPAGPACLTSAPRKHSYSTRELEPRGHIRLKRKDRRNVFVAPSRKWSAWTESAGSYTS